MHKLQAGIEPSLTVFPQPPVLLQPRKAALNHPALGYHRKLGAARCAWPSAPSPLRPTLHAHPVQKALPCARCRTKRSALRPDFPCSARAPAAPLCDLSPRRWWQPPHGKSLAVSTAMWRLIPETFLPVSQPLRPAVSVFLTLRVSTIKSVVLAFRPSCPGAAPTWFF